MPVRFETFFRASSYATVACGALALTASGGAGLFLTAAFAALTALAWALEATRWQLPERAGLAVVLLALPAFYLDWRYLQAGGAGEAGAGATALVHLTLFLSAVKLLQVKADRDWLFLYLISFFEVLLAAGLSVSPLFVATFGLYLFCVLTSAICFELRKARRAVTPGETRLAYPPGRARRLFGQRAGRRARELRRIPLAALFLLLLIFSLALPIFFITPRFGESAFSYAGEQATGFVGFSDKVSLGDVASLQRSDRLVMRVRVEGAESSAGGYLRWRGVTLDGFDGRSWRRSSNESRVLMGGERDLFQFGTTENLNRLTKQTFFVEPLDTPVLFAASRVVAVRGALDFVRIYAEGSTLTTRRGAGERVTYTVYSDTVEPAPEVLRVERRQQRVAAVPLANYLQLPAGIDARVGELARRVAAEAGARNDYDRARAIEAHLNRNEFGGSYSYALEDLPGGDDPLADFLFRVRAGHCEYFSTSMAVMLRSLGIPSRVVNGFQMGEYNAAADAYIVRQHDAHSWVEVYFPDANAWVAFDPTPVAGRPGSAAAAGAWGARLRQYAEAFELFWIQYVVAYDRQEQSTLAGSMRRGIGSYRAGLTRAAEGLRAQLSALWQGDAAGETGGGGAASTRRFFAWAAIAAAVALAALLLARRLRGGRLSGRAARSGDARAGASAVAFYERMTRALAARGVARAPHQTPLEFACALGSPEALRITDAYNRVRYGSQSLTPAEADDIEKYLLTLEKESVN